MRTTKALFLSIFVLSVAWAPSLASAQDSKNEAVLEDSLYDCPEKAKRGKYVVSLKPETTLDDLIKWAMTFHCKNFVYSAEVGKRSSKVTIMTPNRMTASQAWRVFLVGLQSMNLTVVPKGNVLEIVELSKANTNALPIFKKGRPPSSSQMVRVVLRPENLSVDDLAKVLQELKSSNGKVTSIAKAGIVMVTDVGANVAKMADLMMTVDQPVVGEKLYMVRVEFADATELATKLKEILGTKEAPSTTASTTSSRRNKKGRAIKDSGPTSIGASEVQSAIPSSIISDERTNSLIVLGSEAAYLRVKALAKRLDVGIDVEGAGRIHVYRLEHSKAEEMAQTLTSVINGIQQPAAGTTGRRAATPARPTATAGSAAAFEGQVRVTHDQPTNSIVAVASVKDFLALRDVVRKLDVPRPQVYIEANIVEVGYSNSLELGTSWHAGTTVGSESFVVGGVQVSEISSLNPASLAGASGLLGGLLGPLLQNAESLGLGTSIPTFGVLFAALAGQGTVEVLSNPHLMTMDNEEAEISVGEDIPYQSANVGGAAAAANPFGNLAQPIQRQQVGLTLKVTPHINASEMVRLEIELEISDVGERNFEGNGPVWNERQIKNSVVVQDQQPVVIGGLISDRKTVNVQKVPLLGDIPVIGWLLFKYRQESTSKRNLLVVLTPHIIHTQMDVERLAERRTTEQQEFARTYSELSKVKYRPDIDYRRKRGLLEEINRAVKSTEREAQILRELDANTVTTPDGEVQYFETDLEESSNVGKSEASDKQEASAE